MKNTVKKILALVFAVAMICTLAVPAFAEEETILVSVTVVNYDGETENYYVPVETDDATVEEAIKLFNKKVVLDSLEVSILGTTGLVNKVGGQKADKVDTDNLFNTGYWAVALNGKLVSEDLDTIAVEEFDRVVVYWNDPTFDTKLVQVDDSLLNQGVLSFYYYDAEGTRVALEEAEVKLSNDAGTISDEVTGNSYFVTDDEGEIWIAPEYLDGSKSNEIAIDEVVIDALKAVDKKDGYTENEVKYYNNNLFRNIEAADACSIVIDVDDMYNTADATGDMTMVYVLVAAAAVITLAAVVVMKKKAVKAN